MPDDGSSPGVIEVWPVECVAVSEALVWLIVADRRSSVSAANRPALAAASNLASVMSQEDSCRSPSPVRSRSRSGPRSRSLSRAVTDPGLWLVLVAGEPLADVPAARRAPGSGDSLGAAPTPRPPAASYLVGVETRSRSLAAAAGLDLSSAPSSPWSPLSLPSFLVVVVVDPTGSAPPSRPVLAELVVEFRRLEEYLGKDPKRSTKSPMLLPPIERGRLCGKAPR